MSDYPLSYTSSKKEFSYQKSCISEKSACLENRLKELDPTMYREILKGQYVYFEWYFNGRQTDTLYAKYAQFMGATVYKRMHQKVNIVVTNAEGR